MLFRSAGRVLAGGANDLGGTLMEETISRMAGSPWGIRKDAEELEAAIRSIGRVPRERTTLYDTPRTGEREVFHSRDTVTIPPLAAAMWD